MAFGDVVQSNEGTGSTATTNATLSSSPTAGNLIVLAFAGDDYNGTPNSPWTQPTGGEQQTYHGGYLWYHISDGSNSYQYTIGSNSPSVWVIAEIEGPFDSTPLDVSNGTLSTAGGSSLATPSVTPSTGDRAALATYGASSSSALNTRTATFSNSFTTIRDIGASTGGTKDFIALGVRTLTGNGSTGYTTTGTISAGGSPDSQSAIIAVFKKGAGGGGITGTASITEAADTVSSTGALAIKGSAGITEAADTLSATGKLALSGTASITEGADTLSSTGKLAIVGSASVTEGADTVSATGTLVAVGTGTASITEAPDTLAAAGAVAIKATASITEGADTVSAAGKLAVVGTASITEAADTLSATGTGASLSPITGTASIVEDPDILVATGSRVVPLFDTGGSGNQAGNAKRRRTINDDPDAFAELLKEWRERKRKKQAKDEAKQEVSQPETFEPEEIGPELYRQLLAIEQAYERSMEAAEKLVSKRNVRAAVTAAKELEDAQAAYQAALDEEDEEIIALFAA